MRKIDLFIILSLLFIPLQAQYRITGKVTDDNKEPIPGASVVFIRNDSLRGMTLTDKNGKWTVEDFSKGEYQMTISLLGYTPIVHNVYVTKDLNMDFILSEEMTGELNEVTIIANRANLVKNTPKGSTFYLSSNAQNAMNIYGALSEIPMLSVNEMDHTISTAFGGQVMILINGVPRSNALESVDPKDVLSVEVMDTPSARYLSEGFTQVVNIKTRRKVQKYQLLNISTEHNPSLYYGVANGGYELGNDKYSFYVNGKMFYFNNNHYDQTDEQRTSSIYKIQNVRGTSDYYSYNVTLGGDWVINNKSYLSYNAALRGIPTEGIEEGNGTLENDALTTDYQIQNYTKSSSWVNVYNLFHRYTFSKNTTLENALNFTYNWNDDRDEQNEEGTSYLYQNLNRNKTDIYKGNYTAVFGKSFGKSALEIGNQLQYERMDLEQPSSVIPNNFTHSRWKEYLYADYTYNGNPFSFSTSLGWDLTF
ncbi:MAG: carboxypeptidase-like regulatory domain-containing protein, partial [Bacteroides sp.]|nr:carboxypeptidase-like regulatory domain-containing protein [Bacteroides sp.]